MAFIGKYCHCQPSAFYTTAAGSTKSWFGDLLKGPPSMPLPSPITPHSAAGAEDLFSSWKRTLESQQQQQSLFPPPPLAPVSAASSPSPSSPAGGGGKAAAPQQPLPPTSSPHSPTSSTPDKPLTPPMMTVAPPPPQRPPSSTGGGGPATNGGSSHHSSEDGQQSPARFDLKSPFKAEDLLPVPPALMPTPPYLGSHSGGGRIPKFDPLEGHLQDMLRYNMEKYAGRNLDTLGTSRRVRELLSIHNIGQRLFAKYVLGLSQGTVSELLSKPKSWEKLTEKGRDSYRKMHAWCYDENAVLMLKSLIPKKSELSSSRAPPPPPPPHPLPPRPLFPPHSAPGPFPSGLLPPRPPLLKDIQQLKEKDDSSLASFMGGGRPPLGGHGPLGPLGGHGLGLFPNLDKAMAAEPKAAPKMPPSPVEEGPPVSPPPSNIRNPEESMKDALQR